MAFEKIGRYEIVSELGQGAMGVVYKAIDPLIERTVAIKTIKLDLSQEEQAHFEERFYREAKSAGRLNHPNIVTIYDVGKADDIAYMAMEFLEGQSLRAILDAHTAVPIDVIAETAAEVAAGLAYAHDHGVIHRDIKPANVMIVRNGLVKITDFGIALMPSASRTMVGKVFGSPKYMSPEQVVGQAVDGRSDIFSLGVVLYEMLTGESPFDGDNISTIMYRILNENPPQPKSLNPRVPSAFNYIAAKALAKHPDDRYQSAKDMGNDLRNYRNLVIPEADLANSPGRTLERRARPRPAMGDETRFLNQITGGLVGTKTQPPPKSVKPEPELSEAQGSKTSIKLLGGAIVAVAVAFAVTVIMGRTDRAVDTPQPPTQLAAAQPKPAPAAAPPAEPTTATAATLSASPQEQAPESSGSKPQSGSGIRPPERTVPRNTSERQSRETAKVAKAQPNDTKPVAPAAELATLKLAVTPWGEIYVDGERAGVSPPMMELQLAAGKHRIEIRNLNLKPYSETIELKPGTTKKIKYVFQ